MAFLMKKFAPAVAALPMMLGTSGAFAQNGTTPAVLASSNAATSSLVVEANEAANNNNMTLVSYLGRNSATRRFATVRVDDPDNGYLEIEITHSHLHQEGVQKAVDDVIAELDDIIAERGSGILFKDWTHPKSHSSEKQQEAMDKMGPGFAKRTDALIVRIIIPSIGHGNAYREDAREVFEEQVRRAREFEKNELADAWQKQLDRINDNKFLPLTTMSMAVPEKDSPVRVDFFCFDLTEGVTYETYVTNAVKAIEGHVRQQNQLIQTKRAEAEREHEFVAMGNHQP